MNLEKVKHQARDLRKQAPRSPHLTLGEYAILARTLDKCRATILAMNGEYHFDCPVDKSLFTFKGIQSDAFKTAVAEGASDQEMITWVNDHGSPRTTAEVKAWSHEVITDLPYNNVKTRDWFMSVCTPLSLDPQTTTLFNYLDVDDTASFKR